MSNEDITPQQKLPKNNAQPSPAIDIPFKTWFNDASCRGQTALMFPKLCRTCPVINDCLEYALEFPPADMHGVWAGLTSRQLAAEQRRRKIKPTRPTLAQMWGN